MNQTKTHQGVSRWLKEPLFHFLIVGVLLYVAYGLFGEKETEGSTRQLVVTAGDIEWMETTWEKRWNRPPTGQELHGLIQQYIRETVLYREALAMGLDKDDVIIRRRLSQKLEFLFADLLQPRPATGEVLLAYFQSHAGRYQSPDRLTFTQIFFDPDKRGDQTRTDAERIKAELAGLQTFPEEPGLRGDPLMLHTDYAEQSPDEVSKLFGDGFMESILELTPGEWHGPVLSGYGVHLVYVHEHEESDPPEFADFEEKVRQDWEDEERERLNEEFVVKLLARYTVVIEKGAAADDSGVQLEARE